MGLLGMSKNLNTPLLYRMKASVSHVSDMYNRDFKNEIFTEQNKTDPREDHC